MIRNVVCLLTALMSVSAAGQNVLEAAQEKALTPLELLGQRLYHDNRFSSPGSNFEASCNSCHIAPGTPGRDRMYADVLALSMAPATKQGARATTKRNTPTLMDAGFMPMLNHDGSYTSLEALIRDKITGAQFGWEAGGADRAMEEIHNMILLDRGETSSATRSYPEAFQAVHEVSIDTLSREAVIDLVVDTLSAYVRSIESTRTSPYDAWAYMNRIPNVVDIENGDDPSAFAGRIFGNLMNQEGRLVVKVPEGFGLDAYNGMKTFYRYAGMERVGNCVACHYPPRFTDFALHDIGDGQKIKTPTLRDLSRTDPYLHDGSEESLEAVIRRKMELAERARADELDASADAYKGMYLVEEDIPNLVAFLKTLDDVGPSHYRELVLENVTVLKGPFDPNF